MIPWHVGVDLVLAATPSVSLDSLVVPSYFGPKRAMWSAVASAAQRLGPASEWAYHVWLATAVAHSPSKGYRGGDEAPILDVNSVVSQIAAHRCAPCPVAPPCAIADLVAASLLVVCAFVTGVTLGAVVGRGFRAPAPVIHISRRSSSAQA